MAMRGKLLPLLLERAGISALLRHKLLITVGGHGGTRRTTLCNVPEAVPTFGWLVLVFFFSGESEKFTGTYGADFFCISGKRGQPLIVKGKL